MISKTATKESPWYAIPADDKWYTRYLFSEILIDAIASTEPKYPKLDPEIAGKLQAYKKQLENEK